jgi:hypothetical protein
MSTPSYRELFDRLESSGHLSVETRKEAEKAVTASSDGDDSSSRLISVVAGIGAWLTTLFLVFGLIAFGLVDVGDLSSLVIAFVFGAVAVGIDQLDVDRNAFTSQMMLAMSFAAQAVALVGIASLDGPDRLLGATAFCGAMYVLVPSTANRLVSAALLASNFGWETIENEAGYLLLFGWAIALPCVVFGARNALPSRLRLSARRFRSCSPLPSFRPRSPTGCRSPSASCWRWPRSACWSGHIRPKANAPKPVSMGRHHARPTIAASCGRPAQSSSWGS